MYWAAHPSPPPKPAPPPPAAARPQLRGSFAVNPRIGGARSAGGYQGIAAVRGGGDYFEEGEDAAVMRSGGGGAPLVVQSYDNLAEDGFYMGFHTEETLELGTVIDRYGGPNGRYFSPIGTEFDERGLPPDRNSAEDLHTYKVVQPLRVQGGLVDPIYGRGMGLQYKSAVSAEEPREPRLHFGGAMNIGQLSRVLYDLDVPPWLYRLDGTHFELANVLAREGPSWVVFLSERGGRSSPISFNREHDACEHLMGRIALDLVNLRRLYVLPRPPESMDAPQ